MFEKLVLSKSGDQPAISSKGWSVVLAVFVLLSPVLWYVENSLAGATFDPSVVVFLSLLLSGVVAFYVFMLLYTWGDTGRMRISRAGWTAFVALVPILFTAVGFTLIPDLALVIAISGLLVTIAVYLIYTGFHTGEWRRATIPLSTILEVSFLGGLILVPLLFTEALPRHSWSVFLPFVPPPRPSPPQPVEPERSQPRPQPSDRNPSQVFVPTKIPKHIAMIREEPLPKMAPADQDGVPGGMLGSPLTGIIGDMIRRAAPPSAAPVSNPAPGRIRVGGDVQQARLIKHVAPIYPQLARLARIQGTVRLEAIIAKDGSIQNLRILSGPPLLREAARDAALQWRYRPTLLNGEPVEVLTTIDVVFILAQ